MAAPVSILSCGVLVHRPTAAGGREYLFLRYYRNLDLPKGRCEAGETELVCALRELGEETAITPADIRRDDVFRFTTSFPISGKDGRGVKTVVVFLAELLREVEIRLTEHHAVVWVDASDTSRLIPRWNGLVEAAQAHLGAPPARPSERR